MPKAVLSGDIHFNLNNLSLADAATRQAIAKANELNVPFVANGDTTDTKAILRAECVNAMIDTFKTAKIKPYINIGNHCKINNKGTEHALNFLEPYAHIINTPRYVKELESYIIPYYDDVNQLRDYLKTLPKGSRLLLHQGLTEANMGEYTQDPSALHPQDLANFRSLLSHYHARQDIKCGRPRQGMVGLATFIGSAYTVSFAEANDPEKGFQILMDDGTLEFVPTNLRKHVVIEAEIVHSALNTADYVLISGDPNSIKTGDIVKIKLRGTKEILSRTNKDLIAIGYGLKNVDFKLELIPLDTESKIIDTNNLTQPEILDKLIDNTENVSDEQKARIKDLWKGML